jgi:copper resistance protein B
MVGTDLNKLWIKSEGTLQGNGTLDDGQHQFLYSRAITTYFDLQGGLRSDIDSRPTRNWGALGMTPPVSTVCQPAEPSLRRAQGPAGVRPRRYRRRIRLPPRAR